MDTITQVADAMHFVLVETAEKIARKTDFVKRASKITGPVFAQTTVLGWLANPHVPLTGLAQAAAPLGVSFTAQAIAERFTKEAAVFLKQLLDTAVTKLVSTNPVAIPLLQRFTAVVVQDSSTVTLPAALAETWQGCGGLNGGGSAAAKIDVRLDLLNGTLDGPRLANGRTDDRKLMAQAPALLPGCLFLSDLGYFSLDALTDHDTKGVFFLSRLQPQTAVHDEDGKRVDLVRLLREQANPELDLVVRIGMDHKLRVRLLAQRVPEEVANRRRQQLKKKAQDSGRTATQLTLALADWTILVTNAPVELLSVKEALAMAHARWQIELLFKLWKQHGEIDEWRSANQWRILCELYAKLIAMIIQHWLILTSSWRDPDRSLVKAARVVRSYAVMLLSALGGAIELPIAIMQIKLALSAECRINRRRKKPNTYQLLMEIPDHA